MPLRGQPALAVALQQGIGRDDDVALAEVAGCSVPVRPMHHPDTQVGREASGFAQPVAHEADRRHDQRGLLQAASLFLDQDVGQCLQGFAQAHVVGQYTGQAVRTQKLQPIQAQLLVGPQCRHQAGGCGHGGQAGAPGQLLHQVLQAGSA